MLTKKFLEEEYVKNNRTALDIGNEINLSDTQVRYWLKKYNIPVKSRGGKRHTVDLTNKIFGKYTVLEQVKGNGHCAIWKCQCSCGTVKNIKGPMLRRGEVKSCGKCLEHYGWKGYGEISGQYFSAIINGARQRNLEFNITKEYIWNLFLEQNRRCSISGLKLIFVRNSTFENKTQTASLDRIDSSKGYIEGNVQWVHKHVNVMKWNTSDVDFIKWCEIITNYQKSK